MYFNLKQQKINTNFVVISKLILFYRLSSFRCRKLWKEMDLKYIEERRMKK